MYSFMQVLLCKRGDLDMGVVMELDLKMDRRTSIMPLVSVIVPCFNRSSTIQRAIESVLDQTYSNIEIIVVDDGSTDDTIDLLRKLYSGNDKIIVYSKQENGGVACARNVGIKRARGKYISFLDSDDEWKIEHLSEAVDALEATGYGVFMAMWEIELDGETYGVEDTDGGEEYFNSTVECLNAKKSEDYYLFEDGIYEFSVLEQFYFFHINTLVVSYELLYECGGFNESYKTSEDTELLLRLLERERKMIFSKKHHFIYHQSEDGIYSFMSNKGIDISNVRIQSNTIKKKIFEINEAKVKIRKRCKKQIDVCKVAYFKRGEYIARIDNYIFKKLIYMEYICGSSMRFNRLLYALRALHYCHKTDEMGFVIKLLIDIMSGRNRSEDEYLPYMNYW